jgi:hypothetical protein
MRRGNGHAAPSSCEGYPIRCFLLTDSVVYAPLLDSRPRFVVEQWRFRQAWRTFFGGSIAHRSSTTATGFAPQRLGKLI